jgi:hypothetical protein
MQLSTPPADYLNRFDYHITVQLGPVHSVQFKQFYAWCEQRLGVKYRDWFIVSAGQHTYRLHHVNAKWSSILTLTWVDNLVA